MTGRSGVLVIVCREMSLVYEEVSGGVGGGEAVCGVGGGEAVYGVGGWEVVLLPRVVEEVYFLSTEVIRSGDEVRASRNC